MSVEVKVGLLFFLVVVLAVTAGIWLTQAGSHWGTYQVVVHFADTKGLAAGADVLLSGVNIGKVVSVELAPDPKFPDRPVAVTLSLRKGIRLFETDSLVIDQGSLLGDKYVAVKRLTAEELQSHGVRRGDSIPRGGEIAGGSSVGFANLSEQMEALLTEARDAIVSMRDTYANPEVRDAVQQLLSNASQASVQLQQITLGAANLIGQLNRMVAVNQETITRTLGNVEASTKEIREATCRVNETVTSLTTGPIPTNLVITVANIRKTSEEVRASVEAIRGLVCDVATQQRIQSTVADVAKAAADLAVIAGDVKKLSGDEKLHSDIKASLDNLRATTENLRAVSEAGKQVFTSKENLEAITATIRNAERLTTEGITVAHRADDALGRVDRTMDQLGRASAGFTPDEVTGTIRFESAIGESVRGDADFDLRYGSNPYNFWRFGVRSVGDRETLNLQRGIGLGRHAGMRVGIFGNQPGIAVAYDVSKQARFELQAWHPDHNQVDLRTYWRLGRDFTLTLGATEFLSNNDPFIGLERVIYLNSRSGKK